MIIRQCPLPPALRRAEPVSATTFDEDIRGNQQVRSALSSQAIVADQGVANMDSTKQQGQPQSQQDPKRTPGQSGQGQDKGQQPRQGQHDMPKPGKDDHDEEHADKTDRGGRTGAKVDKT